MRDRLVRYLVVGVMVAGMLIAVANKGDRVAAAEQGGFTAAATVIHSTGSPGKYSFPEAPGYPPASCEGVGASLQMYEPGYISVLASSFFSPQKVVVTENVYQKLANGLYSFVAFGNSVEVSANFSYPVAAFVSTLFSNLAVGPDYVFVYHIEWKTSNQLGTLGAVDVAYSLYDREYNGTALSASSVCGGLRSPLVITNTLTGTVNSICAFTLEFYATSQPVAITWDGKQIGTVVTGYTSFTEGSFAVPAAPMGPHIVHWKYGHWDTTITYTVKPRIKLIPNTVGRGQTVNVSLRGYAKNETVRIRWKKGSSWVQIGQVTTSSTGSANINLNVPTFAPNGPTSVRGDGSYGHAQTNAVTVSGGAPLTSSTVKTPTPTPTKSPTATASPIPSATPTLPTATATAVPTESATPVIESPAPTESATPEPGPTLTAEPAESPGPTEEASTPVPTDEPVIPEPTVEPSPTP